jgi:hypothetical protein
MPSSFQHIAVLFDPSLRPVQHWRAEAINAQHHRHVR